MAKEFAYRGEDTIEAAKERTEESVAGREISGTISKSRGPVLDNREAFWVVIYFPTIRQGEAAAPYPVRTGAFHEQLLSVGRAE